MQLIGKGTGLAGMVADDLQNEPFTVIDIGCSGGIDQQWRPFEPNLRAIGIDPNLEECNRLSKAETNTKVKYLAGFADWDRTSEFAKEREGRNHVERNPWGRLAVSKTVEIRSSKISSTADLTAENQWHRVELAPKQYQLPALFDEHSLTDIDFIKIDIDGPDFLVLNSIKKDLLSRHVLGVAMEVNFIGSTHPAEHTFHNTDRFMRENGFELFGLTQRLYSLSALPHRYEMSVPGQSLGGRPFQGDAVYFRDLGNPAEVVPFPNSRAKMLKLAALFDLFDKPDHAAEVLITHRKTIGNVDSMLDWLAEQADVKINGGYNAYIEAFEKDAEEFYAPI